MIVFVTLLLSISPLLAPMAGADELVLHEPSSGATLTLPEDWSFASGEGGLMAVSENRRGFVLLAAVEDDFEQVREDVRTLILTRLDDVVVAGVTVEGVDERGALEEVVVAGGTGTSRLDGETVEFSAYVVKSGEGGALVLGAWKDEAHAALVASILEGMEIKQPAGEAGLELTNARTGASLKIPAGWEVLRNRKGVMARSPDGKAMAILMPWQDGFEGSLAETRGVLLTNVFKDVSIGEFAVVEARYHESLGRVVAASGKAIDRFDEQAVEFKALRWQRVDQDQGAVLFGAWKDEQHAELVEKLFSSIRIEDQEESSEG
jgi:hypothetical protein